MAHYEWQYVQSTRHCLVDMSCFAQVTLRGCKAEYAASWKRNADMSVDNHRAHLQLSEAWHVSSRTAKATYHSLSSLTQKTICATGARDEEFDGSQHPVGIHQCHHTSEPFGTHTSKPVAVQCFTVSRVAIFCGVQLTEDWHLLLVPAAEQHV